MSQKSTPYQLGRYGTYVCLTASASFTYLKITGAIAWAWWLILLPVWGPIALFLLVVEVFFMCYYLAIKKLY